MNASILLAEGGWQEFELGSAEWTVLILSAVAAVVAIGVGLFLARSVLAADQGTPKMQEIARAIQEGASAYLKRQFRTIGLILIPVAAVVFFTSTEITRPDGSVAMSFGASGVARTVAFLMGCLASGFTGFIGMTLATRGNVRTAAAARSGNMADALTVA
ncbi:MAG TPA: sodium/proton-translocating pyrophosphatase, partial [Ilumatobacter sp.]